MNKKTVGFFGGRSVFMKYFCSCLEQRVLYHDKVLTLVTAMFTAPVITSIPDPVKKKYCESHIFFNFILSSFLLTYYPNYMVIFIDYQPPIDEQYVLSVLHYFIHKIYIYIFCWYTLRIMHLKVTSVHCLSGVLYQRLINFLIKPKKKKKNKFFRFIIYFLKFCLRGQMRGYTR